MELHYLELTEHADLLRRREVTSVEVTRAQLERIDRLDGCLKSYARLTPRPALEAAAAADAEIATRRRSFARPWHSNRRRRGIDATLFRERHACGGSRSRLESGLCLLCQELATLLTRAQRRGAAGMNAAVGFEFGPLVDQADHHAESE